jgi:acetyl esterase/lipase
MRRLPLLLALALLTPAAAHADDAPAYQRKQDVIYGRKFGLALTMDVFTPAKPNGAAVISIASGGWFSRHDMIQPAFYASCLKHGYTVFAVVHGSQPKFTVPEIIEDMHRAVRFVRFHAKDYAIDPDRIGIMGASAGGHLSLMQGTTGGDGDPKAKDPIDRVSSKVQAVCAFFPPTDFLNFGRPGNELIDRQLQPPFTAAVDYQEFDRSKARFFPVTDKDKLRDITKKISPIYHVTKQSAPTLLIHGDKDDLVPLQQSEIMLAKLREAGVTADLIVKKGSGHGWATMLLDFETCAEWFDKQLPPAKK